MYYRAHIYAVLFVISGMVYGEETSLIFDHGTSSMVLNTANFAIPHDYTNSKPHKRDTDTVPDCSLEYGLARINETENNIDHLSDVHNVTCSAPAATCARVSHKGVSSIFFCNFEDHSIHTKCGDLIEPAKDVLKACQMGNRYTYGYISQTIASESKGCPYLLVLGDDYIFTA